MWNYVVTAQKPTSVFHSVTGNFTSPTDTNLILSKCTRIEIQLLTPEGLQPLFDVGVYGRIAAMQLYRPAGETQDLLFISTERYTFCILAYDAVKGEIVTRANGEIQDMKGRPADIGQIALLDPENRMIGLHLYDGLLKVIPMDPRGQLKEAFNIRLEELQVMDIQFLHGCSPHPAIAILYQDTKELRHVKIYEVLVKERELREGSWSQSNVESGCRMLIPVPLPLGGCLIIGEQSISYHNGVTFKSIPMKTTVIKAYGRIDTDGSRYLLGDHNGNLYVLILQHDGKTLHELKLEFLGTTSISSCISYLDNGYVFIGSAYGDSQLIKLNSEKDEETGSFVSVEDVYPNLGPIVDFCVVDLEKQGQGQIVTCSGGFKDGSLRIIRNGIGINEQAAIELTGIKGIWSMKASTNDLFDKYLVVSFVGETRILSIAGEELEEGTIPGFVGNVQSLYCGNVINNQLIQITTESVRLVDCKSLALVHEWKPPVGLSINVAFCNLSQILLTTGGGRLVFIEIQGNQLKEINSTTLEHEISCINATPIFENNHASPICAVGLWTDISVRILTLPSLQQVTKEVLGGEIIPRSVLLCSFEGINYLLCGLGDGYLFNFQLDSKNYSLNDRKKISLGTQPIQLVTFRSKSSTNVFAASDRPTVIYSSNHKLLYSNVNLKEVNCVCSFNAESFPDSLTLATDSSLTVGTIDEIQKLHIRKIPIGEMPRRISHQESSRTFLVPTMRITHNENSEEMESHLLRLFGDQTFEILHTVELQNYEYGCHVISCSFQDDPNHYFVVGTAFAFPLEPEPQKGRILVYLVSDQKLILISEKEVKGAAYSLSSFNGKLLACVNNKVQLFKWSESDGNTKELVLECEHTEHILALYMATIGDFIVIGDLMRSISLLTYKPNENAIESIANDHNPNWMTAVDIIDEDTYLGAENSYNLFTVKKNSEATTDEERGKLEIVGQYHLGEFVNRFRHGSLVMKTPESESLNIPTILFGTINGVIGVIASLPQDQFAFFSKLQQQLTRVIKGVGGFKHENWRSFINEKKTVEARRFVDGDLIESFLDLKRDKMEEVSKAMETSVEELCKRIEAIAQATH